MKIGLQAYIQRSVEVAEFYQKAFGGTLGYNDIFFALCLEQLSRQIEKIYSMYSRWDGTPRNCKNN